MSYAARTPSSQRFVVRLRCYRIDRFLAVLPFLTVASCYLLFQRPRTPHARRNGSPTHSAAETRSAAAWSGHCRAPTCWASS